MASLLPEHEVALEALFAAKNNMFSSASELVRDVGEQLRSFFGASAAAIPVVAYDPHAGSAPFSLLDDAGQEQLLQQLPRAPAPELQHPQLPTTQQPRLPPSQQAPQLPTTQQPRLPPSQQVPQLPTPQQLQHGILQP